MQGTQVPLRKETDTHMKRKAVDAVDTCYFFVVVLRLPRQSVVDADLITAQLQFCKHPVTVSTYGNAVSGRVQWQEEAFDSVKFALHCQQFENGPPVPTFKDSENDSCMMRIQNADLGKV